MTEPDGPQRRWLIAALAVAVVAIGGLLAVVALHTTPRRPVAVAAVQAPHAGDPACVALLEAVPQQLGDFRRVPIVAPAPAGTAAWRADGDSEPMVLRCGLDRPVDFVVGSPMVAVDRVHWFQASEAERSTWYAVDRRVYVALTLPPGSGSAPIQQLSDLIDDTITASPIEPGAPR